MRAVNDRLLTDLVRQAKRADQAYREVMGDDEKSIRVWAYRDAPFHLRRLSSHGGDEDWLALLGPDAPEPMWAVQGSAFGVFQVQIIELPGGGSVWIGAHA